jgi:NADPH-dependent 2,4-dienoyl-CoA reductase/sulfur reductase-like enzyme
LVARGIDMPLIGSANLITPDHLRAMVGDGAADFAGVCRMSLDDPDFPNKILNGQEDEIRLSTHTGASLLQGNIFGKGWAGSAQNPNFGRDDEYRLHATPAPKKVVVVGGGSGGMEYAITAKQIGHQVVVLEKSQTLGGAMDWAGNYPRVPNMEMLRYQPNYHRKMMRKFGVDARLGVEADEAAILAEKPDVVVIATGAAAVLPSVPGFDAARAAGFALTIDEAMARDNPAKIGRAVIVWGAGEGAELAIDLKRAGHDVRLLDARPRYTPANYIGSRAMVIAALLAHAGIVVEGGKTLTAVGAGGATFGADETIAADTLIICQGRTPNNDLAKRLTGKGFAVHVIGDARTPRSYANAIHEAAYLARQI